MSCYAFFILLYFGSDECFSRSVVSFVFFRESMGGSTKLCNIFIVLFVEGYIYEGQGEAGRYKCFPFSFVTHSFIVQCTGHESFLFSLKEINYVL